jgi:hypothetical protein
MAPLSWPRNNENHLIERVKAIGMGSFLECGDSPGRSYRSPRSLPARSLNFPRCAGRLGSLYHTDCYFRSSWSRKIEALAARVSGM